MNIKCFVISLCVISVAAVIISVLGWFLISDLIERLFCICWLSMPVGLILGLTLKKYCESFTQNIQVVR